MGLLDDAIREHLELKRLRGADPSDVAREQDAALGPALRPEQPESAPPPVHSETAHGHEGSTAGAASPGFASDSSAGQETVEINMEAELAGTDGEQASPSTARTGPAAAEPSGGRATSGESLEWEMPAARQADRAAARDDAHEDEGLRSGLESDRGDDAPIEDVLEETPDFLRETPEQERLWFEQRPPRDFDFNE